MWLLASCNAQANASRGEFSEILAGQQHHACRVDCTQPDGMLAKGFDPDACMQSNHAQSNPLSGGLAGFVGLPMVSIIPDKCLMVYPFQFFCLFMCIQIVRQERKQTGHRQADQVSLLGRGARQSPGPQVQHHRQFPWQPGLLVAKRDPGRRNM